MTTKRGENCLNSSPLGRISVELFSDDSQSAGEGLDKVSVKHKIETIASAPHLCVQYVVLHELSFLF